MTLDSEKISSDEMGLKHLKLNFAKRSHARDFNSNLNLCMCKYLKPWKMTLRSDVITRSFSTLCAGVRGKLSEKLIHFFNNTETTRTDTHALREQQR